MAVTSLPAGGWLKFILGWALSFALRLVPFRPPNVEPILAVQTPFTKRYGFLAGFVFAVVNIALFDIVTGAVGIWTLVTAGAYGLLALFSTWYFRNRAATPLHYGLNAVYATLLYDAVTGLTIGPLVFGQSFSEAFFGQIPFTLYHLLGNVTLGVLVSPLIARWLVTNPHLESDRLKQRIFGVRTTI